LSSFVVIRRLFSSFSPDTPEIADEWSLPVRAAPESLIHGGQEFTVAKSGRRPWPALAGGKKQT
jgi:hypothetical protein